jgi:hypothetical protein
MATTTMPTQRVVQLWTPDPALNATNVRRRPLTPCSHLLELQRRSAEEDHGSTVTRFRKPVPPPSHHNTKAHVEVASLLDICAQAILLHQHRQRTTRKSSPTAHHNAPSSGRHHHWAQQKQEASLSVVATTGQFDMDLLPRELRAYLSEHWLCVVCQRPTRGQLKSHTHNSHHDKGRPGANYPGWCPACVQRASSLPRGHCGAWVMWVGRTKANACVVVVFR